MNLAQEAVRSLASACGILNHRPNAFDGFNQTLEGFWRSFCAVLLILPISWLMIEAGEMAAAEMGAPESGDPLVPLNAYQGSFYVIAFFVVWPVAVAGLARLFDLGGNYVRYIIAYNWLAVPLAGILLIPDLLYLMGLFGPGLRSAISLIAYGITLYYCWYLARAAFETTGAIAFAFVVADVAISFGLAYLFSP